MSFTLYTTTDYNYLPYFSVLYKSLKLNSPSTNLYCRFINVPDEEIEKFDLVGYTKESVNLPPEYLAGYCNNIRFDTALKLFKDGMDNLLYVDCDAIVRKDLSDLDKSFKRDVDFLFVTHPAGKSDILFCGGLVGMKNTDTSREFLSNMILEVNENWGKRIPCFNQKIMTKIFFKLSSKIHYGLIDHKYKDINHTEDTIMWSGVGSRKNSSSSYLDEMKKYGYENIGNGQ